jgi:hypothetical protein
MGAKMAKQKVWLMQLRAMLAKERPYVPLYSFIAVLAALLLAASRLTWDPDEGFHLTAAELINAGKTPYVDFFYQHPPGYAYVNAWWMHIFGETWRSSHVFSSLLTSGAVLLIATFVFSRLASLGWGVAGALIAAVFTALQMTVISYGTIGQPYALCLFLTVCSFRLAISAVDREGIAALASGLCAGTAAASSLLCSSAVPTLLLWLWLYNRTGERWRKCGLFLLGTIIPSALTLWVAWRALHAAWFDIIQYHLFYRQQGFWLTHHAFLGSVLHVAAEWLGSAQDTCLVILAAVGVLFVFGGGAFEGRRQAEFRLCTWLVIAISGLAACAHPTFLQYFIFTLPFLGILASVGVCAIGSRVWTTGKPVWLATLVAAFFCLDAARWVYFESRTGFSNPWSDSEEIGQLVDHVTPPEGLVYADEQVFFAAKRLPPSGLENTSATLLELPSSLADSIHAVSHRQWIERLKWGRFDTAVIALDEISSEDLELVSHIYRNSRKLGRDGGQRMVFWNKQSP